MKPLAAKLLAFDTSANALSIAVQNGPCQVEFTGEGGAKASERLIPEIQALMAKAGLALQELDAIAFGAGPGAFTGLRTSCAVAQGLGFGANVSLLPISTLHALAVQIHAQTGQASVTAALDARMGEVYWQVFNFEADLFGVPMGAAQLSLAEAQNFTLGIMPRALDLLSLAGHMLAKKQQLSPEQASPLYVRNKVAQTTAEREAEKAPKASAHG